MAAMTARGWLTLRRVSQVVFLLAFVFLLLRTEYRGYDVIRYPANTFFQFDPLLGLAAMLSARVWIAHFWPATLTILVTLLLGRVFCGWFCPMGTLLDIVRRCLARISAAPRQIVWEGRRLKYYLLAALLAAAAVGWQAAWFFDPFSLFIPSIYA